MMGNEINAVIVQTILYGLLGVGFAASSVIWEMDSKADRNLLFNYFCHNVTIAYFAYWMEHSIIGFLIYIEIFTLIFVVMANTVWYRQI